MVHLSCNPDRVSCLPDFTNLSIEASNTVLDCQIIIIPLRFRNLELFPSLVLYQ